MKTLKAVYLVTVITGLLTGLSLSSSASAQDISGTWHGKLTVPTGSLTLVFHINQTGEGTYITTLDSPDQGANGIKTQTTSFKDSILTVQTPVIHASYKGKLSNDRSISGTFTQGIPLPLNLEKGEASRSKRPQEPQPPFSYKSEEVTVRNEQDGINLAGTFTLPEKGTKFPAVVMVTGSGAQNRDEEIMGHKPFLVIADYLTRNGIAVLRCDDRGTAASQGNHATATNEDFARDTEAAIHYLRGRKEINTKKIGIIGHSAGGTIAFIVAANDPSVAFIVRHPELADLPRIHYVQADRLCRTGTDHHTYAQQTSEDIRHPTSFYKAENNPPHTSQRKPVQEHRRYIIRSREQPEEYQRKFRHHHGHQDEPQALFPPQLRYQLNSHELRHHVPQDLHDRNRHLIVHIEYLQILESGSRIRLTQHIYQGIRKQSGPSGP